MRSAGGRQNSRRQGTDDEADGFVGCGGGGDCGDLRGGGAGADGLGKPPAFLAKWGSEGSGDGQFRSPWGIAVDASGNVYVADFGNDRVQKFGPDGAFITKWGSEGTGDGQFAYQNPTGLAVDPRATST